LFSALLCSTMLCSTTRVCIVPCCCMQQLQHDTLMVCRACLFLLFSQQIQYNTMQQHTCTIPCLNILFYVTIICTQLFSKTKEHQPDAGTDSPLHHGSMNHTHQLYPSTTMPNDANALVLRPPTDSLTLKVRSEVSLDLEGSRR